MTDQSEKEATVNTLHAFLSMAEIFFAWNRCLAGNRLSLMMIILPPVLLLFSFRLIYII
jgi:hypothetical protein